MGSPLPHHCSTDHLCGDCDLNLHPSLNVDNDLLYHLRGRIQVNQPLMDSHLEHIPRLASLAAGRFPRGHFQGLGWEADWSFDA